MSHAFQKNWMSISWLVPCRYSLNFKDIRVKWFYSSKCWELIYKTTPFLYGCRFKLALSSLILARILLCCGIEDYDIFSYRELKCCWMMEYPILLISLTLNFVLVALREIKPTYQRKVQLVVQPYYK